MADARKPSPKAGSTARQATQSATASSPAAKGPASKKPRKNNMAESESETVTGNVFDVERIRRLVELMKEHDLNEIDLRESRHRIRIQRGAQMVAAPQYAAAYAPPPMPAPAATAAAPAGGGAKSVAMDGPGITVIKSPMVGTFYCRANPKSNPFVKVGDRVDTNTTVCIVEAMKVFNEIPAEVRGTIVAVLVEDGEAVEFDKPLFKVDTSK
jgi:acetyl-CoA carboxylase biotin carboxyl carrier protein